ncbi:MAG: Verru_Chthon cassette protein A [Prosthecobacter sp.]|uniref:Verru_Chthon cassette protein A n=1 Tax=Prosthecobacter sp. TaxID=1965333 RepID=UPI003902D9D1
MMLALLMVLVLAILQFSRTETKSAVIVTQITEVRTLAELPVNLVMGQIREATSNLNQAKAWASQPGMIRVFGTETDDTSGRAKLTGAWKLYSSNQMVAGEDFDPATEAAAMTGWHTQPATFADLNAPAILPQTGGTFRKVYPIFDPAAVGLIDGVSLDTATIGTTQTQPAPMPVRWLYVLRDGRFTLPTEENDGVAEFDTNVVSATNPIVGRIAFWTDDESCKVNINTASEGTPWDVPRAAGWTERNYAEKIPAANEFQRFPGHPATTSLSAVLQAFDDRYKPVAPQINSSGVVSNNKYAPYLRDIYALLPRTHYGSETAIESSRGGTAQVPATLYAGVPAKGERLYSTVDEFFFQPQTGATAGRLRNGAVAGASPPINTDDLRMARFFLTAHSRAPETNLFNRPRLSLWPLQADVTKRSAKDKLLAFCATAARDKSTGKGREHGFQRTSVWQGSGKPGSAQSSTEDFMLPQNQATFGYLQSLTSSPVPGFGPESFATKYSTMNRYQILLSMLDLQRWGVNSWYSHFDAQAGKIDPKRSYYFTPPRAVSGVNSSFVGEAMAVPLVTASTPKSPQPDAAGLKAFGRFPTISEVVVVFMATEVEGDDGKPLTSADAAAGNTRKALDKKNNFTAAVGPDHWGDNTHTMRAYVFLQPYTPVVGMPPYTPNVRYAIDGLDSWKADGIPLGFPDKSKAINRAWTPGGGTSNENGHATAYTALTSQFLKTTVSKTVGVGDETDNYPFVGTPVSVKNKSQFAFSGGALKIKIFSGFGSKPSFGDKPVQEINLNFPPVTLRVPRLGKDLDKRWTATPSATGKWDAVWTGGKSGWLTPLLDLQRRFDMVRNRADGYPYPVGASTEGVGRQIIVGWGDTVRSVFLDPNGPTKGDYRALCALPVVTPDYYVEHPDYKKTDKDEAQSLRFAGLAYQGHFGNTVGQRDAGRMHVSNVSGKLLKDVWFWQDCQPAVPKGLNGAFKSDSTPGRPGDWDNGVGRIEDGPYINKPDEGGLDIGGGGYFGRAGFTEEKGRTHSPNRQICSAVAFGSLPTGVYPAAYSSGKPSPWQTLLFCPNPPSRVTAADAEPQATDHYGFKAPRDHLMLDLFWMPIVEPYAISEPFSTAGKINMNFQMMPFTHITRATGLHAALRSVRVNALPAKIATAGTAPQTDQGHANVDQQQRCYKSWQEWLKLETNYEVNAAETLQGFQRRFTQGDVFRSASEICDLFLVPQYLTGKVAADYTSTGANKLNLKAPPQKLANMTSWWNGDINVQTDGFELTGDNTRESPYNQLYPRLTTRSNVFQVHYRVQALKKARSTPATVWDEKKDRIGAEQRGSVILERYIDPNDPALPDFVADPDADGALDDHYRFRIIRSKIFAP